MYIDTLTLNVSTVQYDSISTSSASRLLVGYHDDEVLGKMIAKPFFQVQPSDLASDYELDESTTRYLRASLVLAYDGYSLYDTTQFITLSIHQLTEDMDYADESNSLYNVNSFTYAEESVGQLSFKPRPGTKESIEITLNDNLGTTLMELMWTADESVSNSKLFLDTFKGFTIVSSGTATGSILGLATTPELRVYYLDNNEIPAAEKYVTFSTGIHFNNIRNDRSDSPLQNLSTVQEALSAQETGNMAFTQGSQGMAVRVEVPYLRRILIDNPELIITNAVLEFAPVKSFGAKFPGSLKMEIIDKKNATTYEFEETPFLVEDLYLGRDTHYQANVELFLTAQLALEEVNQNALLFRFANEAFQSSADVLAIEDGAGEHPMKLRLYFAVINDN